MSEPVTADALVERVAACLCGQHWQAPCAGCDGECRFVGQARAAIAAVAEAADIGARQLRSTAEYLALVGTADDRRVAALLRALAEVARHD